MNQPTFNFETSRQLNIPFPQWVSQNQELLEQAKDDAKNPKLSEADRRTAAAAVETLKQTPLVPVQ
jgi:rRNA maturation endonuclease Nob1